MLIKTNKSKLCPGRRTDINILWYCVYPGWYLSVFRVSFRREPVGWATFPFWLNFSANFFRPRSFFRHRQEPTRYWIVITRNWFFFVNISPRLIRWRQSISRVYIFQHRYIRWTFRRHNDKLPFLHWVTINVLLVVVEK